VSPIPTRWRTTFEEQLADAGRRIEQAEQQLAAGDGGRALQQAYPAVVSAATVIVWLDEPPWQGAIAPAEMQGKVRARFPNLFAALAALDLKDVLTSPWTESAAQPYIHEARQFLAQTRERLATSLNAP
jgi:hypothetical protein